MFFIHILKGSIVNRTYGTLKKLHISLFHQQYLVLFTVAPSKYSSVECIFYPDTEPKLLCIC